jgi:hypothetical protein
MQIMMWSLHQRAVGDCAQSVEHVVETVDPNLILIDSSFDNTADTVERLGRKYKHLGPNMLVTSHRTPLCSSFHGISTTFMSLPRLYRVSISMGYP